MKKTAVLTIGHSNRTIGEFLKKLKDNKVAVLVDVRTSPYSRYCPHFNQKALSRSLSGKNIQYLWRGKNLGGKAENVNYEEAIDELVKMARKGVRACVMCTEKDPENCHRTETIEPSLQDRKVAVNHILWE